MAARKRRKKRRKSRRKKISKEKESGAITARQILSGNPALSLTEEREPPLDWPDED